MLELCRCPNIYGPDCSNNIKKGTGGKDATLLGVFALDPSENFKSIFLRTDLHIWKPLAEVKCHKSFGHNHCLKNWFSFEK